MEKDHALTLSCSHWDHTGRHWDHTGLLWASFSSPQEKKTMKCQLGCIMQEDDQSLAAFLILTTVRHLPTNQRVPSNQPYQYFNEKNIWDYQLKPTGRGRLCHCVTVTSRKHTETEWSSCHAHTEMSLYFARNLGEMEPFNKLLFDEMFTSLYRDLQNMFLRILYS